MKRKKSQTVKLDKHMWDEPKWITCGRYIALFFVLLLLISPALAVLIFA